MLLNASIVALEGAVTPGSLMLYLATLCALTAIAIAVGIVLHRRVLR